MKLSSFDRLAHASDAKGFIMFCLLLRFALAYLFLFAAWDKLVVPGWTATAYLQHATGPFSTWFQMMAGNTFVDGLVMYGELLIGVSFLFGALMKPAAFFGGIMMLLFYFSSWNINTAHGFVGEHVVIALVCGLFLFGEFGHWFGLDGWFAKQPWVQSRSWLLKLF